MVEKESEIVKVDPETKIIPVKELEPIAVSVDKNSYNKNLGQQDVETLAAVSEIVGDNLVSANEIEEFFKIVFDNQKFTDIKQEDFEALLIVDQNTGTLKIKGVDRLKINLINFYLNKNTINPAVFISYEYIANTLFIYEVITQDQARYLSYLMKTNAKEFGRKVILNITGFDKIKKIKKTDTNNVVEPNIQKPDGVTLPETISPVLLLNPFTLENTRDLSEPSESNESNEEVIIENKTWEQFVEENHAVIIFFSISILKIINSIEIMKNATAESANIDFIRVLFFMTLFIGSGIYVYKNNNATSSNDNEL